jgi:hypothetical protein
MFVIGLAALLAVCVVLIRLARQALDQSIAVAPAGEKAEPVPGGPDERAS